MKKNYIFKTFLFLIPITAFALMSLSSGRTGNYSGSPGDSNTTCTVCHGGGNFNASVEIQTGVPANGYALDVTYNIQVNLTATGSSKHGFQLTAEKVSDGSKIGTFIDDGTNNQVVNGGTHVTHTSVGNTQQSWTFSWKAPSTDQGEVKFYVAANAANGNGETSGDQIVTATSESFSLGVADAKRIEFSMYPNPSTDIINIQLPSGIDNGIVKVYNYTGKLLKTQKVSSFKQSVDVSNLSKGIYLVKIIADGKLGAKQFIKK